jgi:hypothetical protein
VVKVSNPKGCDSGSVRQAGLDQKNSWPTTLQPHELFFAYLAFPHYDLPCECVAAVAFLHVAPLVDD